MKYCPSKSYKLKITKRLHRIVISKEKRFHRLVNIVKTIRTSRNQIEASIVQVCTCGCTSISASSATEMKI